VLNEKTDKRIGSESEVLAISICPLWTILWFVLSLNSNKPERKDSKLREVLAENTH